MYRHKRTYKYKNALQQYQLFITSCWWWWLFHFTIFFNWRHTILVLWTKNYFHFWCSSAWAFLCVYGWIGRIGQIFEHMHALRSRSSHHNSTVTSLSFIHLLWESFCFCFCFFLLIFCSSRPNLICCFFILK